MPSTKDRSNLLSEQSRCPGASREHPSLSVSLFNGHMYWQFCGAALEHLNRQLLHLFVSVPSPLCRWFDRLLHPPFLARRVLVGELSTARTRSIRAVLAATFGLSNSRRLYPEPESLVVRTSSSDPEWTGGVGDPINT